MQNLITIFNMGKEAKMIQGKGIYLWQFRRSDGGNLTAIVDNLKRAGMTCLGKVV